jgi:hypothetical protein
MGNELTAALMAAGPHAALGDQANVFDRIIGAWDCDYVHFTEDGAVVERGERSADGGKTWWLQAEYLMTRHSYSVLEGERAFAATDPP